MLEADSDCAPCGVGIPGYTTIGLIRNGSMGRVFKARQTSVERDVAIKVLHHELARKPEFIKRFRREGALGGKLSHTNIVHLLDAGNLDGCPYLVMEYAEGGTVQDRLDAGGAFDEASAVAVALTVAEALGHVHGRGIVHRDVKPANVILSRSGVVKLIDFGLARAIDDGEWATAEAGDAIGTPEYISPEQVRGQSDLDARGDLYSLGATLYHMVTGRPLYLGTSHEVMRQHTDVRIRPVPPDRLNPELSAGLVAVLATMTATNRASRYQDVDTLIADLERVLRGDAPLFAGRSVVVNGFRPHDGTEGSGPTRAEVLLHRGDAHWYRKEYDLAAADYEEVLRLDPLNAGAYYRAGGLYLRSGDYPRAQASLSAAARLAPESWAVRNRVAWMLATCPDPAFRDGAEAVVSADRARELTNSEDAGVIDTLAAACAEVGDFGGAVYWQEKAVGLLSPEHPHMKTYQARLDLYRDRTPYRDGGGRS